MADVEYWFPTPLWFSELNVDNKPVEKFCKKLAEKSKGRVLSNVGGWQSDDLYFHEKTDNKLKPLFNLIWLELKNVADKLDLLEHYKLNENTLQFWININNQENYNAIHNHPCSFLSGVYYVKVPKNSGNIIFHHPNPLMKFWYQQYTKTLSHESHPTVFVEPKENKLVIFPSWLEHVVEPNKSKKDRISIAFNIALTNNDFI